MSRRDKVFWSVPIILGLAIAAQAIGDMAGAFAAAVELEVPKLQSWPTPPPVNHEDTYGEQVQAALLQGKPFGPAEVRDGSH
jgi:hypothetical protein